MLRLLAGELASLVQTLQELYVMDALWGVPTAPPAAHVSSEGTSSLLTTAASTPQVHASYLASGAVACLAFASHSQSIQQADQCRTANPASAE